MAVAHGIVGSNPTIHPKEGWLSQVKSACL